MLSTVTPSRRGCQLSSSVSIETIRSVGVVMRGGPSRACPQSGTHPTRPIEAAQPATAPARSKRHQLPGHDRRGRPLPLVRLDGRDQGAGGVSTELARSLADRKSTRLNSSHDQISYAVFCLQKKKVKLARQNHAALERRLREFQPEIVAWWAMGGLALTMLETVRRRGLPAVAFVHDDWLDYGRWADRWLHTFRGRRARLAPVAERLFGIPAHVDFDGAARYVFVSERTRRHALGCGLALGRTAVAHSGIHEDFLDPAPVEDWRWRLLYVGRLDARKGVDTAVAAMAHLPDEARLELIGGGGGAPGGRAPAPAPGARGA